MNRSGLGSMSNKVFSKVGPKEKRNMVSEEVSTFENSHYCFSGQTMYLDKTVPDFISGYTI